VRVPHLGLGLGVEDGRPVADAVVKHHTKGDEHKQGDTHTDSRADGLRKVLVQGRGCLYSNRGGQ